MPDKQLELKKWLSSQHNQIMGNEREALSCLAAGNTQGYLDYLHKKAELLSTLYKNAKLAGLLSGLPESVSDMVDESLQRFSAGASTALSLNSPFYMSALLYPDDHREGEPDNLERLINSL